MSNPTTQHGGKRTGAGRPPKHGEATKVMRVPVSKVGVVKAVVAGQLENVTGASEALDSLLLDVMAVADTLRRKQGGITKAGAAEALKMAVSDYAEVAGWQADDARQRDRARREAQREAELLV